MKLSIAGIRGIPACYGGFETFAEELATRLHERGWHVTVYGRSHVISHRERHHRGVELVLLPAPRQKYLETPLHSLLCFLHLAVSRFTSRRSDAVLVCNAANSPFLWILRLAGLPCAVNVDGIERRRAKWNLLGRLWYCLGEYTSKLFANRIVSDAEVIRRYYLEAHGVESTVIPYGFDASGAALVQEKLRDGSISASLPVLEEFALEPGRYLLYVSRLEPENNAHVVLRAYNALGRPDFPLVIVGDAPYAAEYIASLRELAGPGVIFTGFRFGKSYRELQLGAYCYVQATEVGGTHPALVEAMGFGNCIIANDTPENREVLAETGVFYQRNDPQDLTRVLEGLLGDKARASELRALAYSRAQKCYSWERVTDDYERLLSGMIECATGRK